MDFSLNDRIKCLTKYFGQGQLTANQKNFDVWCPFCDEKRKDKRKLSIHVETALYQCWRCGHSGRHVVFVVWKFRLGDPETLLSVYPSDIVVKKEDGTELPKPKLPDDFRLLVTTRTLDPDVLAIKRYCRDRGMTEDDLWYYKIGFSKHFKWARRAIVPSFDAFGHLNYYTARAVDRNATLRYNTVEVNKLDVVFNELNIDWSKRLVLCEGPFDVMKCGQNATPLLGSNLNENSRLFCTIVVNRTSVALALDTDMREKTLKMVKKFEEYDVPTTVVDLGKHKDPGEMTKAEFEDALSKAAELDWKSRYMEKLAKARKVSSKI